MDASTGLKENMVKEFIMSIDFSKEYSLTEIKLGLKRLLGEMPGVEIVYNNDVMVTEENGVKKRKITEKIQKVTVAFIDGEYPNGMPIPHKFEYYIG